MAAKDSEPEHALFEVNESGDATAVMPSTVEELGPLADALRAAGFDSVDIQGVGWHVVGRELIPLWSPYEHPEVNDVRAVWVGPSDAPSDTCYVLSRIGSHYFEAAGETEYLGSFDNIEAAVEASEMFRVLPSGRIVLDRSDDPVAVLLEAHDVDLADPDLYWWWYRQDFDMVEAVVNAPLLNDHFSDWEEAIARLSALGMSGADTKDLVARSSSLPVGDEDLDNTLRWSVADAARRGVSFVEALDLRLAAYAQRESNRTSYASSVVEIADATGELRPAVEVAAGEGTVFAVITAHNPMSVRLDDDANAARHEALTELLGGGRPALGRSANGEWREVSLAVPFTADAVEAAQQFAQAAIFRVTANAVEVVDLVGEGSMQVEAD